MKTIRISDWFDPKNTEHMMAWAHLQNTGSWPKSFWDKIVMDDRIDIHTGWQMAIAAKLADAFTQRKLENKTEEAKELAELIFKIKDTMTLAELKRILHTALDK